MNKISFLTLAGRAIVAYCWLIGCNPSPPPHQPSTKVPAKDGVTDPMVAQQPNICVDCIHRSELDSFENKLGSRRLDLSICEIEAIFFSEDCSAAEAKKQINASQRGMPHLSIARVLWDVYLRPRRSDSLPLELVFAYYDTARASFDTQTDNGNPIIENFVLKYSWREPRLEERRILPIELKYLPDTTRAFYIYAAVLQQFHNFFASRDTGAFAKPLINSYFFQNRPHRLPPEYVYLYEGGKEGIETYVAAPWREHYDCNAHGDTLDGRNGIPKGTYYMRLCLGWSRPDAAYFRSDTIGKEILKYYDLEAEDLAIYFGFSFWPFH